jgi:hypothetical protein
MFVYFIPLTVNLTKNSKLEKFVHELNALWKLSGSSMGALRELVPVAGVDDEAAGQLRRTDLHCIIVAALDGHEKQPIHYHALRNNYTSLMCASYLANHPYEKES